MWSAWHLCSVQISISLQFSVSSETSLPAKEGTNSINVISYQGLTRFSVRLPAGAIVGGEMGGGGGVTTLVGAAVFK